jgi:hypothetical protein
MKSNSHIIIYIKWQAEFYCQRYKCVCVGCAEREKCISVLLNGAISQMLRDTKL